ncbi:MAG: sugar transferase [Chitinophagaceae bacterium]|nr:sugar transferase [Chitinophagaceae bacterium]
MISGVTSIPLFLNERKGYKNFQQRSYVDNKRAYFILKRVVDIFVSVLFILFILSWFSVIIALIITADSRGLVFFIQRRVGKTGRSFPCFKFRTMIVNRESDNKRAVPNDPRITRVGKFLRNYNLDEFPQFLNVLLGHMSIVGPRPHMHSDCYAFAQTIPGYKFRTFVKPGITGLAQAKGFHGPVANQEVVKKRFEYDAFYVRNASVELDLRIITATVARRTQLFFCLL